MFFEGAPRVLKSGARIHPFCDSAETRIVVEAYPKLVAQACFKGHGYKADDKKKQTEEHRNARGGILTGLQSARIKERYGFAVNLNSGLAERALEDPTGDVLDAILCAVQAAWAWRMRKQNFGVPRDCDPLEGWITDPALLNH
jgi:hypothetical protein